MSRVIAIAACGFLLTACSSSWMPSFEMPSMSGISSSPQSVALAVESDPPGAEARASGGAPCRTPCTLNVTAAGNFTVTIALNGYLPQSVPVRIVPPEGMQMGSESPSTSAVARVDPNPVFVELERAPATAPVAKKKPAPKRPPTAARSAPTTAAAPATPQAAPQTAPAPAPASSASSPWPMPR